MQAAYTNHFLGIPSTLYAKGDNPDEADLVNYITQIYYTFRGEIPHIKHPKLVWIIYKYY